jgi:hypothetical protein
MRIPTSTLLVLALSVSHHAGASNSAADRRMANADRDLARRAWTQYWLDQQWRAHMQRMQQPGNPLERARQQSAQSWQRYRSQQTFQRDPDAVIRWAPGQYRFLPNASAYPSFRAGPQWRSPSRR